MTNLVATTPITTKAMKNLYAELNRQKELKRTYRKHYKDLQAVVATSTDAPTTTTHSTVTTNNKNTTNIQPRKTITTGPQKKIPDKGKTKIISKGKKSPNKLTPVTTNSSPNLHSHLRDKAKHTAALIQEITEELQAMEEESVNDEHDSDVMRASDLEHEDTNLPLTEDDQ